MTTSDKFEEWVVQRQWWVALIEMDQYGVPQKYSPLSIWPTRDLAQADVPNHGHKHRRVAGRWIPHNPSHDYEQIEVVCREVRIAARPDAVPEGWVLVPVEPTEAMIHALPGGNGFAASARAALYSAMLKAAPKPGDAA